MTLLFSLLLFASQPPQKTEPPPAKPELAFVFNELARANTAAQGLTFSGPRVSLELNTKGEPFLVDLAAMSIYRFDPQGQLQATFGKPGQGPGEFANLIGFGILQDDSLLAVDNRGSQLVFLKFAPDGTYLEQKALPTGPRTFQIAQPDPTGQHLIALAISSTGKGNALEFSSSVTTTHLVPVFSVSNVPEVPFKPEKLMDASYWSDYLADLFKMTQQNLGLIIPMAGGQFLSATTLHYQVSLHQPNGAVKKTIKKDYTPIPLGQSELQRLAAPIYSEVVDALPAQVRSIVTPAVVNKALEKAELPPVKPPILGLIQFRGDSFFVVRDTTETHCLVDLFDASGQFRGPVKLPPLPVTLFGSLFGAPTTIRFFGDKAFALEQSADEDLDLVIYQWTSAP